MFNSSLDNTFKVGKNLAFELIGSIQTPMIQVMHRLWKKPGVSQQYLAEQTAKDKACLTNLINNLEKKGWVERRGNPTDRRNKQIYLTEEGERLALRVKPLLHGIYGLIGDEMPSRQIVSCRNNLQKINSILDKL